MKRKRILLLFAFLLCVVLFVVARSVVPAFAAPDDGAESAANEELQENIDKLLEALDTSELQAYLNTLTEWKGVSVKEKIAGLITGDSSLDYSSLFSSVLELLWDEAKLFLPAAAVIIAVALL